MDPNATLIVQSVTFLVFVALMWRLAWPQILGAMEARQAKIAEGLSAAERGEKALKEASSKSEGELKAARAQAQEIISAANKQSAQLVEKAKADAEAEKARILAAGRSEAEREIAQAKEALRKQVGELAVAGASKILKREIDAKAHADVLSELAAQV
jgi:F-type H+-transporting ATPase subunit b